MSKYQKCLNISVLKIKVPHILTTHIPSHPYLFLKSDLQSDDIMYILKYYTKALGKSCGKRKVYLMKYNQPVTFIH